MNKPGFTSSFTLYDEDERQASLFSDAVLLDPDFFAALKEHPVPFVEGHRSAITASVPPGSWPIFA